MSMLATHLAALETLGLVAPALGAGQFLFRHALIQDTAYRSLLKTDRRVLHLAVGETLERLYSEKTPATELAPQLAQHFDEAQEAARALKYFTLAGDAAAYRYATAEAIQHYTRAIALAQDLPNTPSATFNDLYTRLGRMFEVAGRYPEAERCYRDLLTAARARGDWSLELTALMALALVHALVNSVHNPARSGEYGLAALALAQQHGDRPAEARLNWILMLKHWFAGQVREGEARGQQALALARELELRELQAYVLNDLGAHIYFSTGRNAEAVTLLSEALALWRELNNVPMLVDNLNNLANLHQMMGRSAESLALAQEAHLLAQAIGNAWGLGYNRIVRALLYFDNGELDEARAAFTEAHAYGAQGDLMFAVIFPNLFLGLLSWLLEAPAEGLGLIAEALRYAEHHFVVALADLYAIRAGLELQSGLAAQAEASQQLMRAALQRGLPLVWGMGPRILACEQALWRGDDAALVEQGQALVNFMKASRLTAFMPEAYFYWARGVWGQGQHAAAVAIMRDALAYRAVRRAYWLTEAALAVFEERLGHSASAQTHRAAAQTEIAYLLEHLHHPPLRAAFLAKTERLLRGAWA